VYVVQIQLAGRDMQAKVAAARLQGRDSADGGDDAGKHGRILNEIKYGP
jgi:hypothetical protein